MVARNPSHQQKRPKSRKKAAVKAREGANRRDAKFAARESIVRQLHGLGAIDLEAPTMYPPGSKGKSAVLAARYELGLPMHVVGDRQDWSEIDAGSPRPRERSSFFECGAPSEGDAA
jgi:hypothetical protein